ncbi:acyl-CoA thioesterase [Paraferrimonas sedimenticola]|uniref:Thioesterase n=1 Tax=Paraferrimonas sedimenticola TaxID=375674 RepID=A0AA37VTW0_9GAMM|nr:thioesterase family protein [Paraferrimonas sedimenticola]GLP95426.1 thioesterase [Paraferrimonas sedimenticola]
MSGRLVETITPRFCETDGLQHINNTVIPVWCEATREPIFEIFNPGLKMESWNLIVAGFEVKLMAPSFYGAEVRVETHISRVGNASFEVTQDLYQGDRQFAQQVTQMVHYDYQANKSCPIPEAIRAKLAELTA